MSSDENQEPRSENQEASDNQKPTPIDWDQLQSLKDKLKALHSTSSRLTSAYFRSQVKASNRINTLSRLSNALLVQAHTINREIDRHLADLRKIRVRENADNRRLAASEKQAAVRPELDRHGKRRAKRVCEAPGKRSETVKKKISHGKYH